MEGRWEGSKCYKSYRMFQTSRGWHNHRILVKSHYSGESGLCQQCEGFVTCRARHRRRQTRTRAQPTAPTPPRVPISVAGSARPGTVPLIASRRVVRGCSNDGYAGQRAHDVECATVRCARHGEAGSIRATSHRHPKGTRDGQPGCLAVLRRLCADRLPERRFGGPAYRLQTISSARRAPLPRPVRRVGKLRHRPKVSSATCSTPHPVAGAPGLMNRIDRKHGISCSATPRRSRPGGHELTTPATASPAPSDRLVYAVCAPVSCSSGVRHAYDVEDPAALVVIPGACAPLGPDPRGKTAAGSC